jgi:predicted MFS family arabinose efflux permease
MILAGAFFLVGAVLLAAAPHIAMLIMGRVIMGLGGSWLCAIQVYACMLLARQGT